MCEIADVVPRLQTMDQVVAAASRFRALNLQLGGVDEAWLSQGEQVGAALDGYLDLRNEPEITDRGAGLLAAFSNFAALCAQG